MAPASPQSDNHAEKMDAGLKEILQSLPDQPGVYLHKDGEGRVLYVGKAKSLRSRVRSYFQQSADHQPRIQALVRQIRDIEIFQTRHEAEALILESTLIKKHKPRYNISYKDDKSYPFFKLTTGETYPRLFLSREKLDKGAEYFGPYASVKDARETLNMLRRHFKLRTSKMALDGTRTYRPCINFQLRKCLGPCRGEVSKEAYGNIVDQVRLFFQGRDTELVARLEAEMAEQAGQQRYEEAAKTRDAIGAVKRTLARQQVLVPDLKTDQDVFALCRESNFAGVEVLFIRNGRLIGSDFLFLENTEGMEDGEVMRSVLNRIYIRPAAMAPREILIPLPVEDMEVLQAFLSQEKGSKVHIQPVVRGEKRRLIELAQKNAGRNLKERMARHVDDDTVMEAVRKSLHLKKLPRRVEAFDISNIQGTNTVASMVVWENNQPHKDGYRKYKLRTVVGPDDFKSMHEVLTRRYKRATSGEQPLPDLILIDGGKGQLNIAEHVLIGLGISLGQVDLIGLAKGKTDKRRGSGREAGEDYEYVVKPGMKNEIRLRKNSPTLHFLQRIRDESHRTAVTFHRSLRKKTTLRSELEDLPGVGRKRAQNLLRHFGSLKKVREASKEALLAVPGLPKGAAEGIFKHFSEAAPHESVPNEGAPHQSVPNEGAPREDTQGLEATNEEFSDMEALSEEALNEGDLDDSDLEPEESAPNDEALSGHGEPSGEGAS